MGNIAPPANTGDTGQRVGPANIPVPTAPPQAEAPKATPAPQAKTPAAPTQNAAATGLPNVSYSGPPIAGSQGLQPDFQKRLDAMIAASGGRLAINSGYRDVATQTRLHDQAVQKYGAAGADKWVAPPGHSNHNRGLAADLSGDLQWAHDHAAEFGLVFPMSWENWHIEPVYARDSSSAQAYTAGPPGTTNPTQDPTLNSTPEFLAAHLVNAMTQPVGTQGPESVGAEGPESAATPEGQTGGAPESGGGMGVSTATGGGGTDTLATGGPVSAQPASASQQDFINTIRPYAEAESQRTGIPAEVFMVQSGLETGWGTSGWWKDHLNPAGIGVTGAPGAGYSYPSLSVAFRDYADHLMGHGEAGQDQFAADVRAGASPEVLLADIQRSPWAAGQYGGNGLTNTYNSLKSSGVFTAPAAPAPAAAATGHLVRPPGNPYAPPYDPNAPGYTPPAPVRDTRRAAR